MIMFKDPHKELVKGVDSIIFYFSYQALKTYSLSLHCKYCVVYEFSNYFLSC